MSVVAVCCVGVMDGDEEEDEVEAEVEVEIT
jgi:hypothetical protein